MFASGKSLPVLFAGWTWFVALCFGTAAGAAVPVFEDPIQLLKQADSIKTSNHIEFNTLLQRIDHDSSNLSQEQKFYLNYLKAWQVAYRGDYETAIPLLDVIIKQSRNADLRSRADATVINVLAISAHYEQAFDRLNLLLEDLPQVHDKDTRRQALAVAAQLYIDAGQYELAETYADQLLAEYPTGEGACRGRYYKFAANKSSMLQKVDRQSVDQQFHDGIGACMSVGEALFANGIRSRMAVFYIQHDEPIAAINLLQKHYSEVSYTHYHPLISLFDARLAQAYWALGNADLAKQFALGAIGSSIKNANTEWLVAAYNTLYQVEKRQGDFKSALTYHEKYMAADKAYLNDVSAKALAYQTVKQQVLAKKQQIDALDKRNHILQLQRALDKKAIEANRLYLILLLIVLASIAFFAYRLKRSQLRFMRMARRDGLTGLFNRQHFLDEAPRRLSYCKKSSRDACVVLIDLDHFKNINDTHGHVVGDEVLKRAVTACQAHLRSTDIFGRLGGEEFGILLPECSLEQVTDRVEKLRLAVAKSPADDVTSVGVSASFGVATTTISGYELRQLLIHADDALYQAKNSGRNRAVVFVDVVNSREAVMRKSRVGIPQKDSMDGSGVTELGASGAGAAPR